MGADCKSVGLAFEGSNPSPATSVEQVSDLDGRSGEAPGKVPHRCAFGAAPAAPHPTGPARLLPRSAVSPRLGSVPVLDVPWGYLVGVLVAVVAVVVALRPPPTDGPRATAAFVLGTASSEVPLAFLLLLIASTLLAVVSGDLAAPAGWVVAGLAAGAAAGLVGVQLRAFAARGTVVAAVDTVVPGDRPAHALRPVERWRTVVAPLRWPSRDVQVVRNLSYGPHGPGQHPGRRATARRGGRRSDPGAPSRRWLRQRSQEPGGPATHAGAGSAWLGVAERELPARSGRGSRRS